MFSDFFGDTVNKVITLDRTGVYIVPIIQENGMGESIKVDFQ